jgi:hypothetical protein
LGVESNASEGRKLCFRELRAMPYGGDTNAFEASNLSQMIIQLQQKDYYTTAKRLFHYNNKILSLQR